MRYILTLLALAVGACAEPAAPPVEDAVVEPSAIEAEWAVCTQRTCRLTAATTGQVDWVIGDTEFRTPTAHASYTFPDPGTYAVLANGALRTVTIQQ